MAVISAAVLNLWLPVAAYMAVIFYFSSLSNPALPPGTSDTSWHTAGYLGLALVTCRALAGGFGRVLTPRMALVAFAIVVGYGVTDEWHQSFVPGRTPDVGDIAADALGACMGTAVSWAWGILRQTRERR